MTWLIVFFASFPPVYEMTLMTIHALMTNGV